MNKIHTLKLNKMKKIILLFISVLTITTTFAQKGKVTAAESLLAEGSTDKAKEAIDLAMTNEKSNTWPKTYIVAAKIYTQLYKDSKDSAGVIKAAEYYEKAIEFDKKGNEKGKQIGRYKKEIGQALVFFGNELTNAGVEAFNKENYTAAVKAFSSILDLNKNEYAIAIQGEKTDTSIIYNAALAAYNGEDWENAEKYFGQAIDLKYGGGDAVLLLDQVYQNAGDSTKMDANLKKGFELYPEDSRILTALINYYLTTKQNDKAFDYLNTAIEKDATNPSFYYARGVLNDNSKNFDKALADYNKCLELDPEYFNALYNVGVMYFNKGVEQMNDANSETDSKKYNEKKKVGEATLKEALPYFEKAEKLAPDNANKQAVLESLKTLYYRFDMTNKYKAVEDQLNAL